MNIIEKMLPDYCYPHRPLASVDGLIIHYFSAINVAPNDWADPQICYELFLELNLPGNQRGPLLPKDNSERSYASAHYMIDRKGLTYMLVPETQEAWHAGRSFLNGRNNCNKFTLGIELIATHDSGFTDDQYLSLEQLSAELITAHSIQNKSWVVGHEHIAPGRKKDPGPKFDWSRYYNAITGAFNH